MAVGSIAQQISRQRSAISGGIGIEGDKKLMHLLSRLPDQVFARVVGKATAKAATPVSRTAKRLAPKQFGILRKSIGKKTVKYRRTQTVLTYVGPRLGFKQMAPDGRYRNPVFYAHLMEGGHNIVRAGSLGQQRSAKGDRLIRAKGTGQIIGRVAAQPFMRPAYERNRAEILRIFRQELGTGIRREAGLA